MTYPPKTASDNNTLPTGSLNREAWLCPRCQRVNAPHVNQCTCTAEESYQEWHEREIGKYFRRQLYQNEPLPDDGGVEYSP